MKVDFSAKILGPDDQETELTLGEVASTALNHVPQGETLTLEQSVERGTLAIAATGGETRDITPEQSALIRAALPKIWSPVVVARAAGMLS